VLFSYWKQIVGLVRETGDFSVILILPMSLLCSFAAGLFV